jgi:hypothetical protein
MSIMCIIMCFMPKKDEKTCTFSTKRPILGRQLFLGINWQKKKNVYRIGKNMHVK